MGQLALLAVSTAATVVGTVKSVNAAKKADKLQRKQQNLERQRQTRAAIREAQLKRAQAISSANASGAGFGSGIQGGISSLGSQFGGTLGYASQMSGLSSQIGMATNQANTWGSIADMGMKGFSGFGGWDFLKGGLSGNA